MEKHNGLSVIFLEERKNRNVTLQELSQNTDNCIQRIRLYSMNKSFTCNADKGRNSSLYDQIIIYEKIRMTVKYTLDKITYKNN